MKGIKEAIKVAIFTIVLMSIVSSVTYLAISCAKLDFSFCRFTKEERWWCIGPSLFLAGMYIVGLIVSVTDNYNKK